MCHGNLVSTSVTEKNGKTISRQYSANLAYLSGHDGIGLRLNFWTTGMLNQTGSMNLSKPLRWGWQNLIERFAIFQNRKRIIATGQS
jgi:hypothetical protein